MCADGRTEETVVDAANIVQGDAAPSSPTPLLEVSKDETAPGVEPTDEQAAAQAAFDDEEQVSWAEVAMYSFLIIAGLYGFLFGLGLMGTSFKVLGGKTAGDMFTTIKNPIAGLMIGVLATVLVQSSSTSTSVVVGMVGADIIDVKTAIPVIMGANIGTSVTNTIVSLGQMNDGDQYQRAFSGATVHDCFNMLCVAIFLPLEVISHFLYYWTDLMTESMKGSEGGKFKSPIKIIVSPLVKLIIDSDKKKINKISEGKLTPDNAGALIKGGAFKGTDDGVGGAISLIISLLVLCLCLYIVVKSLRVLVMGSAKKAIKSALSFTNTWWGGYVAMLVGVGVTIAVQSSSITTSTLTPLVGVGVITVEQMFPLTLGANIGTTVTALLAALVSGKVTALQIALCHLFFNIFGILIWYPIERVRAIPIWFARQLGFCAWAFKWFPIAYIFMMFVLVPLLFLGLSALFEAGPAGIAFGVILVVILLGLIIGWFYFYYYRDGKAWIMSQLFTEERMEELNARVAEMEAEIAEAKGEIKEDDKDMKIHV